MIKDYYRLTKPGIIYGNSIALIGGFLLGVQHHFPVLIFLASLVGMALVIGCGCVLNNYIDRDIDQLMSRTRNRVSVRGVISLKQAMVFAVVLGILGLAILALAVNLLTMFVALFGLFVYVVLYSLWFKRSSGLGTWVGAISGAMPPVVGYCAVTGRLDLGAILVFLILYFWQLPHFFAITIFRTNDYKTAGIPVLSVTQGVQSTKYWTLFFLFIFLFVSVLPFYFGYVGIYYLLAALMLSVLWLLSAIKGFKKDEDAVWAKRVFMVSIIVISLLCLAMGL
ncbi:heme o synthase [Francisellaceae bacterium]|nr:heme o synthase [Francisellaceae bacterium]